MTTTMTLTMPAPVTASKKTMQNNSVCEPIDVLNSSNDDDNYKDISDSNESNSINNSSASSSTPNNKNANTKNANSVWEGIVDDFDPNKGGDRKILRAIGRTATVNAVVALTATLGPIAAVAGYATGGAITAKRLIGDGIVDDNPKEIVKSLAVFGSATSASVVGQAVTGAVMIGVLGASLPLAGAIAFSVGCVSGITAGAVSEWGVDEVMDDNNDVIKDDDKKNGDSKEIKNTNGFFQHLTMKQNQKSKDNENNNNKKNNIIVDSFVALIDRHRQRKLQKGKSLKHNMKLLASASAAAETIVEKRIEQYHQHSITTPAEVPNRTSIPSI